MKLVSISVAMLLLSTTRVPADSPPQPDDYVRGVEVTVPVLQPLIELTLDDVVYQTATRDDLRDLRVFNAAGAAVTHAFCVTPATTPEASTQASLAVFELRDRQQGREEGARVEVQTSDGTLVNVQEGPDSDRRPQQGSHIIDATHIAQPLRTIEFDWQSPDGAAEVKVSIQASADLDRWSIVVPTSTLLRVARGEQELRRERVELPLQQYKYLRVARADGGPTLAVHAVTAEVVSPEVDIEPLWFAPKALGAAEAAILSLDTGRVAPIEYARVRLPQENTSIRVTLQSRADEKAPWITRWSGETYLIVSDAERRESPPARFEPTTDRYWRLQLPGDASVEPSVEFGYRPLRLRFLGQGPAPFTIAAGSRRAALATPAACNGLLADVAERDLAGMVGEGYIGAVRALGGDLALQPAPKETPVRLIVLWAVLIGGVGALVAMALSLLKRLR
jgi:hypothetical protein